MKDHPHILFVYRCAAGHTLIRRTRADCCCGRCGHEGPPDKSDRERYLIAQLAYSDMMDFAEAVRIAENKTFRLTGAPMKYIGCVVRKASENEIAHACRAVDLKDTTIN